MDKIKMFEDFVPVGFGSNTTASFALSGSRNIGTGYNMDAFVGPALEETCNKVAEQAYAHEANDNPEHTKEGYVKEAKDLINKKIDEACESYGATNEAMVSVAGRNKPSGAFVLAKVISEALVENGYANPNSRDYKKMVEMIQDVIMDSTF